MRTLAAKMLRRLACRIDGCLPVSDGEATHCGSCGRVLLSKEFVCERVGRMFDEAWAEAARGRPRARA